MLRPILHLVLHGAIPGVIARLVWRERFWTVWLLMVATMLVDLDHLVATPIYDPSRCSIGYHPLHSPWAVAGYALLLLPAKTRVVAVGLLIHMALDVLDCLLMVDALPQHLQSIL